MKVFLSSTAQDLTEYRKVAEAFILKSSHQIVAMEHFGALPGTPSEECERLVSESDVVVCIVAHRFGSGITRREVEAAHRAGKDVLAWIVSEDHKWVGIKETDLLGDPEVFGSPARTEEVRKAVEDLNTFKDWLQENVTTDAFTTPDDLGGRIALALAKYSDKCLRPVSQDRISIARLPTTGADLFGREAELKLLDDAWANPRMNVVSFVAWGGVGKTALVNHWLKRYMARDNYRGAERVYGWSFFSQGTKEGGGSADLFIDQALRWFGDADPTAGSPWEKGARLAHYIRQSRTLLILDGLEPLQHPPGSQEGRLKDAALQTLLVELAAQQPGLCLISTRERVGDLVEFENGTIIRHNLECLSPAAGAQILRSLNVNGDDSELEKASGEFGGHAFSLTLLGSYLDEVLGGDIRRRSEIENLFDDSRYGEMAQRMIAAYEKWLGEGMEMSILRLLGLFDRPADLASIHALCEPPVISGLTEPVQHFKGRDWNKAIAKLRRIKLLADASPEEPGTLDAHPLLREHFKQRLIRERIDAWREGNNRLYEHLKSTTKNLPDTVEEMTPLFAAVAHGCSANRHEEVLNQIYFKRIKRGNQHYSSHKLGTFSAELAAMSHFFEQLWELPTRHLSKELKWFVFGEVGSALTAFGRLQEAVEPSRRCLEMSIADEEWINAGRIAANFSSLNLEMGNFSEALKLAKQGVELAGHSDEIFERVVQRSNLGDVLHQHGRFDEAERAFVEAESLGRKASGAAPPLFSSEFLFCDFLLTKGQVQTARDRAEKALENSTEHGWPSVMGLNTLILARSWLHGEERNLAKATDFMNRAIQLLHQAGRIDILPKGLLPHATLYRLGRDFERAERSLMEVFRIARRSGMTRHLADYHLESARLCLMQGEGLKAGEHLSTAREMINRMGYHRRDKEVQELEAQLA